MQDGNLKGLGFRSRTLLGVAIKYHSSKLKLLVLKLAMCDDFQDYSFHVSHFDLCTDYNPLTYINSSCKIHITGQRLINEEVTDFNFSVHYKPGVENVIADSLSRLSVNNVEDL